MSDESGRDEIYVRPDFLVLILDPRAIPTQINVVLNWFEELRAKAPTR